MRFLISFKAKQSEFIRMIYCLQTLIRYQISQQKPFLIIFTVLFPQLFHNLVPIFGSTEIITVTICGVRNILLKGEVGCQRVVVAFLSSFNERGYSLFFLNTSENLIWYVKSNLHFKQICIKCPSCTLIKLNPNISS